LVRSFQEPSALREQERPGQRGRTDRLRPEPVSALVRPDQQELGPVQVPERQERTGRLRREPASVQGLEPEQVQVRPEQTDRLRPAALVSAALASELDRRALEQRERTDRLPLAEQVSAEPDRLALEQQGQTDRLQPAALVSAALALEPDRLASAGLVQQVLGPPVSAELASEDRQVSEEPVLPGPDQRAWAERVRPVLEPVRRASAELVPVQLAGLA
jgi:hypothetical protein